MLLPPPKPPDHGFPKKHVEFQVMWDATMAPPSPEPSDVSRRAVVSNTFGPTETECLVLLQIAARIEFFHLLVNLWNLNIPWHIFVMFSEVTIIFIWIYPFPFACVALISFSKCFPQILEAHALFFQRVTNVNYSVFQEKGVIVLDLYSNISDMRNAQHVFDEMSLSGTCYFSIINWSLDFKQWDPGTIKVPKVVFLSQL
jgi:hypothetical protein